MSSEDATFRFKGRATGYDTDGYYVTRWDNAQRISVVAKDKSEAHAKAILMLGFHPRFGWKSWDRRPSRPGWAILWDSIDEEAEA